MMGPRAPVLLSLDRRASEKPLLQCPVRALAWKPPPSERGAMLALATVIEADLIAVTQAKDEEKDPDLRRSDSGKIVSGVSIAASPFIKSKDQRRDSEVLSLRR